MAEHATIQVLEKNDFTKQHMVTIPVELPPIGPSSVRVRTKIMSLTTNNISYARLGDQFGWYDVHPLPANMPIELSDRTRYGRISAWGWVEVIESTFDSVPVGSWLWGYVPIGTLPEDLHLKRGEADDHVLVTNPYRQQVFHIYNRYLVSKNHESDNNSGKDSKAWDALVRVFHETGSLMNKAVFAWGDMEPVHPLGPLPGLPPWTKDDANLTDAVVIILAASGKTALSFAYELRHTRPKESQPRQVIAVTSESSKPFVKATGFHDQVLLYSESARAVDIIRSTDRVIITDCGGRGSAADDWTATLRPLCARLIWLGVGGEPVLKSKDEIVAERDRQYARGMVQVNVSGLRDGVMAQIGEVRYFREYGAEWNRFRDDDGAVPGMKFKWGRGMDDVAKTWDVICSGGLRPDVLDVFDL